VAANEKGTESDISQDDIKKIKQAGALFSHIEYLLRRCLQGSRRPGYITLCWTMVLHAAPFETGPLLWGQYLMPEFQPIYDFETDDFSSWPGVDFGKMFATGRIGYIKPAWGLDNS
jgi:hypothetical protein